MLSDFKVLDGKEFICQDCYSNTTKVVGRCRHAIWLARAYYSWAIVTSVILFDDVTLLLQIKVNFLLLEINNSKINACDFFYRYKYSRNCPKPQKRYSLQWRHNERDGVFSHWRLDCLLNHLFRLIWKKTSKLHVTGLCEGNSPVNYPHKGASNAENVPFDNVVMTKVMHEIFLKSLLIISFSCL